jgi:formylmethanofuran dehydrogenase subunit E
LPFSWSPGYANLVYVEIDRCATDAIAYVTGVKLGWRSLKFIDHGIMAPTFVNLENGRAFRSMSAETTCREFNKCAIHATPNTTMNAW